MSDTTPNLALPLVAAAQAQKHVTVNEALAILDRLGQLAVLDRDLAAPPGSPAGGDRYIVAASATGDWAGHDGEVATFDGGAWAFDAPAAGWRAWLADEGLGLIHDGTGWRAALAVSPNGATIGFQVLEEEVTLAGATTDTAIEIPDRAIVFAVTTRTTETVTGASSYDCGIAGETDRFGASLGAAAGSTNSGVVGPTAFYAATPVRLTANGGSFTGGKVRAAIHFMLCGVPAA
jgi:hypothetical protein